MKRLIYALAALACVSCGTVRVYQTQRPVYGTTTTVYPTSTVVTTTGGQVVRPTVQAMTNDIALQLDLQAVAAVFAQSSTIQDFEMYLNDPKYMISNLDLNGDGYIDYLRVMSTMEGSTHLFVIQAVLGNNMYQDVATLVAELPSLAQYHIEVIGNPYIYGPNYVVVPTYYTRPYIFTHIYSRSYRPWCSPWYWRHYPSYYRYHAPCHYDRYHTHIVTYMSGHRYCREVVYVEVHHYTNYYNACRPVRRDDYAQRYPEKTFTTRYANMPQQNSAVQRAENAGGAMRQANANDLRKAVSSQSGTSANTSDAPVRNSSTSTGRGGTTSAATRGGSTETSTATVAPVRGNTSTATASPVRGNTTTAAPVRGNSSTATSTATVAPVRGNTSTATPVREKTSTATAAPVRGNTTTATKTESPARSTTTAAPTRNTATTTSKVSTAKPASTTATRNTSTSSKSTSTAPTRNTATTTSKVSTTKPASTTATRNTSTRSSSTRSSGSTSRSTSSTNRSSSSATRNR